jgi:hypothetical protein
MLGESSSSSDYKKRRIGIRDKLYPDRQYCHNSAIVCCADSTLYGATVFVVTVCQYCKTPPWAYTLGFGSGISVCQMICLFCSASNSGPDI